MKMGFSMNSVRLAMLWKDDVELRRLEGMPEVMWQSRMRTPDEAKLCSTNARNIGSLGKAWYTGTYGSSGTGVGGGS